MNHLTQFSFHNGSSPSFSFHIHFSAHLLQLNQNENVWKNRFVWLFVFRNTVCIISKLKILVSCKNKFKTWLHCKVTIKSVAYYIMHICPLRASINFNAQIFLPVVRQIIASTFDPIFCGCVNFPLLKMLLHNQKIYLS